MNYIRKTFFGVQKPFFILDILLKVKTTCFIKKHITKKQNLLQNLLKSLESELNMIC